MGNDVGGREQMESREFEGGTWAWDGASSAVGQEQEPRRASGAEL